MLITLRARLRMRCLVVGMPFAFGTQTLPSADCHACDQRFCNIRGVRRRKNGRGFWPWVDEG
eukprot:346454-Amphidinium_carterae.1